MPTRHKQIARALLWGIVTALITVCLGAIIR